MLIRVKDDGHDMPGRSKRWRGALATELSQEIPFILGEAVVDFEVVVVTVVVIFQVKVVKGQQGRGSFCDHYEPSALGVIGVESREIRAGEVAIWCGEDSATFDT